MKIDDYSKHYNIIDEELTLLKMLEKTILSKASFNNFQNHNQM